MKKILLIAPLILTGLLGSCNKTTYTVTEEEFNHALHFDGVEYLKAELYGLGFMPRNDDEFGNMKLEFSPTVFHILSEFSSDYSEKFVYKESKESAEYFKRERDKKGAELSNQEATTEDEFQIPNELGAYLFETAIYSDFTFDEKEKAYVYDDPQEGYITSHHLYFENEKIVSYRIKEDGTITDDISFSYHIVTPEIK